MSKKSLHIYQFKITLKEIKPKIWRRIQVPENYSFWDLHVAIQDSMGWYDCHLHQFEAIDHKTGFEVTISMPDEFGISDRKTLLETKAKIADYFLSTKDKVLYEYDFGDGRSHEVILEKIIPALADIKYPVCIAGERACPPEDCGGPWGYAELLEILADPKHPEYKERKEWIDRNFDPGDFVPESVVFNDPKTVLDLSTPFS